MDVHRVGIVGAGVMGKGIAQTFAEHAFAVMLVEPHEPHLNDAKNALQKVMRAGAFLNINFVTSLQNLAQADLVIEAIDENEKAKKELFRELDQICQPNVIFATDTSSLSINELAKATKRSQLFIGMHFMNPAPLMRLVELVRGKYTSDATYLAVKMVCEKLGKVTAVSKDSPGFVVNRLLMLMINDAVQLYEQGIATKEDIDLMMKYGLSHPMGPLRLADYIGLDICHNILTMLFKKLRKSQYKPARLLAKMVKQKKLGRKTGEGFYKY